MHATPLSKLHHTRDAILARIDTLTPTASIEGDPVDIEVWAQSLLPILQCIRVLEGAEVVVAPTGPVPDVTPGQRPNLRLLDPPAPPPAPPSPTYSEQQLDNMATGPGLKS